MVTCFRSPSRALFEAKIFSARWAGARTEADASFVTAPSVLASGWPHFRQNLAPSRFASPQPPHAASSRAPHSSQNAASLGFSARQ